MPRSDRLFQVPTFSFGRVIPLLPVLLLLTALVWPSPSGAAAHLSDKDTAIFTDAFKLADAGKFDKANKKAAEGSSDLLKTVIEFQRLITPRSGARFAEIAAFMDAHPLWPLQSLLQRRAEEAIHPSDPQKDVLKWFEAPGRGKPITADGQMALARALMAADRQDEAIEVARTAWITGNFGRGQERQFYALFKKHLTKSDHIARLDRLLWDRQITAARHMLKRVDKGHQHLAQARILLIQQRGGVDQAIQHIPDKLKDDPGLVFERLQWRRRKGRYDDAVELLRHKAADGGRPVMWWIERALLAREALQMGHISEAYEFAANHSMSPTAGARFADAEWFAGWVALQFLAEPETAYKHFTRLHTAVSTPVSRSRGAFWAGRAAEAQGKKDLAQEWYRKAAPEMTTYYGQLSAGRLKAKFDWPLPQDPLPTKDDIEAFNKMELVEVVKQLDAIGVRDPIRWFIHELNRIADTPGKRALTAALSVKSGRPDLAVWVARKANADNVSMMVGSGYPAPTLKVEEPPEHALALAVIRQESNFNEKAVSRVGARGLMQLMPFTAKKVAKGIGEKYSRKRLTADPDYNIRLGTSYLGGLIEDFNGSYILALASYNAGPHRVTRWIRQYGDPRTDEIDPIDWIEMIPFTETRNYVQRVLEGLQVYRRLLGRTELALTLEKDLVR